MPDLGSYAFEVGLAYLGTLAIVALLVWVSLVQSRRAKRRLDEAERRRTHG